MFLSPLLRALGATLPFLLLSTSHFASPANATPTDLSTRTQASRRATDCNGHAALCDKSYGAVTVVGAHNSYAVGTNNLFANQDHDVIQQLTDGIRMLQLQVHNKDGAVQLCHSVCSFMDGGLLEDYLKKVKGWLDTNPNNVITFLIVNVNNFPASTYDGVFQAAGLASHHFSPASSPMAVSAWPTLGSMIDAGTNVVTFLDNGADPSVPYLLDEFSNMWETAFNVIDADKLANDCSVDRTQGDPATQLYLINHFLDKMVLGQPAPDVDKANVTNSASGPGNLLAQVEACRTSQAGRAPNFLLVDFYEYGNLGGGQLGGSVFQIASDINQVPYNPTSPIAQPVTSGTASSGSSSNSSGSNNNTNGASPVFRMGVWPTFFSGSVVAALLTL